MTIRKQIIITNTLMITLPAIVTACAAAALLSAAFITGNVLPRMNDVLKGIESSHIIRYSLMFFLFSSFTALLTAFSATIILSNKILAPIKDLTSAAYSIKNGQLDFELLGTNCKEINELCRAFDGMRLQLKESKLLEEKQITQRRIMLANISHDLKTPLTSIKGYISGIKDGVASSPEKLDKYLSIIYKKAEIIENMINNMSELSMLEMSKENFNFEYGCIIPFIQSVTDEYAENKNARISLDFPETDAEIKIDYIRMRRVLCNIIDNSIKYRKGDISNILLSVQKIDSGIIISVSDDGIGIRSDDTDKVFECFYRADPSRTPNIKGTGLGLAIAREIVNQHGGKIWLKSGEDGGLTVYIYLKNAEEGDELNEKNTDN